MLMLCALLSLFVGLGREERTKVAEHLRRG